MSIAKKLRCEYMENPIGSDVQLPRISWQIQSETRSWLQSAYQLHISAEASFESLLGDSGKVLSDQSIHIEIKDLAVKARQRY